MSKCTLKTNYNSKVAYNAAVHKCRFEIEEEIDDRLSDDLPDDVGIFLTSNNESLPVFYPRGSCERVISRKEHSDPDTGELLNTGARIVLTRDNFGHRATGLGGAGSSKCEAIDIVAGSLSCAKTLKDGNTQSRANFAEDGARLYLTERGDVNAYFATAKSDTPGVSADSKGVSGAGLKADHTLIIGRQRVRILAGLSKYDGGERLVDGNSEFMPRIEIGATSSEKHHQAVLGNNLVKYLEKVNDRFVDLSEKVLKLEFELTRYKMAMAGHTHTGVGTGAIQTFPDAFFAIPEAAEAVPETLNSTKEAIMNTYDKEMEKLKTFGIESAGLEGSKEDKILSSTVYIGE